MRIIVSITTSCIRSKGRRQKNSSKAHKKEEEQTYKKLFSNILSGFFIIQTIQLIYFMIKCSLMEYNEVLKGKGKKKNEII